MTDERLIRITKLGSLLIAVRRFQEGLFKDSQEEQRARRSAVWRAAKDYVESTDDPGGDHANS